MLQEVVVKLSQKGSFTQVGQIRLNYINKKI